MLESKKITKYSTKNWKAGMLANEIKKVGKLEFGKHEKLGTTIWKAGMLESQPHTTVAKLQCWAQTVGKLGCWKIRRKRTES